VREKDPRAPASPPTYRERVRERERERDKERGRERGGRERERERSSRTCLPAHYIHRERERDRQRERARARERERDRQRQRQREREREGEREKLADLAPSPLGMRAQHRCLYDPLQMQRSFLDEFARRVGLELVACRGLVSSMQRFS
jgi:hypothetical protein